MHLPNAPKAMLFLTHPGSSWSPGPQDTRLAHGQLMVHQDLQLLLFRSASQQVTPACAGAWSCSSLRWKALYATLLNIRLFFSAHLSSMWSSLWRATQPSGVLVTPLNFMLSMKLLRSPLPLHPSNCWIS